MLDLLQLFYLYLEIKSCDRHNWIKFEITPDNFVPIFNYVIFVNDMIFTLCRNKETEILKGQIDVLTTAIEKEEEKAKDLEHKSK